MDDNDSGAGVLLHVAALKYARAMQAWRACFPTRTGAEQTAEARRAVYEARAQLQDAARRFARVPMDWEAGYERASQRVVDLMQRVIDLTRELEGLRSFKRGVDEALNSDDGSCRL